MIRSLMQRMVDERNKLFFVGRIMQCIRSSPNSCEECYTFCTLLSEPEYLQTLLQGGFRPDICTTEENVIFVIYFSTMARREPYWEIFLGNFLGASSGPSSYELISKVSRKESRTLLDFPFCPFLYPTQKVENCEKTEDTAKYKSEGSTVRTLCPRWRGCDGKSFMKHYQSKSHTREKPEPALRDLPRVMLSGHC